MWPKHAMECPSATPKNEILPGVTTWMDLEGITLGELKSDRERQIPYDFTHMWSRKVKANERTQ